MFEKIFAKREPRVNPELFKGQKQSDFGVVDSFKAQKEGKQVSLSGDFIFKDIQLFKPEALIIVITIFVSTLGFFLANFLIVLRLDELKNSMTETALNKVAGLIGDFRIYALICLIIPSVVMLLLFLYKFLFLYPSGKKRIVIRAWKNNLARISVESIKDNKVQFDESNVATQMYVGNERKCTDVITGRPVILLEEGEPENSYLHKSDKSPEKFKDENNVRMSTWATATRYQRYIDRGGFGLFSNPTNLILIMVLIVVVIIVIFLYLKTGNGGLMESAGSVVQNVTAHPNT